MNDLDLCLEVESRSCQPLRYIQRSLSRKPLEIVAWFQRTTNRKWPMGSAILVTAWLLFYFFCCVWCAIMPLTGVITTFLHLYLLFIAGFSYRTRLVSKQSWSHSHSLNTYTTHFMSKFQLYYMAVVAHYSKAQSVPYCRLPIFLELITNMWDDPDHLASRDVIGHATFDSP